MLKVIEGSPYSERVLPIIAPGNGAHTLNAQPHLSNGAVTTTSITTTTETVATVAAADSSTAAVAVAAAAVTAAAAVLPVLSHRTAPQLFVAANGRPVQQPVGVRQGPENTVGVAENSSQVVCPTTQTTITTTRVPCSQVYAKVLCSSHFARPEVIRHIFTFSRVRS